MYRELIVLVAVLTFPLIMVAEQPLEPSQTTKWQATEWQPDIDMIVISYDEEEDTTLMLDPDFEAGIREYCKHEDIFIEKEK
jgi:hypothetical protein